MDVYAILYKLDKNITQLIGFFMVEPTHLSLNPRLHMGVSHFSEFIIEVNDVVLRLWPILDSQKR
jgi:hypothetical protein